VGLRPPCSGSGPGPGPRPGGRILFTRVCQVAFGFGPICTGLMQRVPCANRGAGRGGLGQASCRPNLLTLSFPFRTSVQDPKSRLPLCKLQCATDTKWRRCRIGVSGREEGGSSHGSPLPSPRTRPPSLVVLSATENHCCPTFHKPHMGTCNATSSDPLRTNACNPPPPRQA